LLRARARYRKSELDSKDLNGGASVTSIKEIAALAGVSRGTVDRALNNRGGVNREVAERIRRIAAEKDYKTNRAALALAARKKPLKIGAIFPVEGNVFFLDVIAGLRAAEEEFKDYGVSAVLKTMRGFSVEVQLRLIDELVAEGIQALVIAAINEKAIAHKLNELVKAGIPVVTSNTDIEKTRRLCYVGQDYQKSGETAAGLLGLVASGRPFQVVLYTGSIHILGHNQRVIGFNTVLKNYHPSIKILDVFETMDDTETAYNLTKRIVEKYPNLDAIYMTAGGIGGTCKALVDTGNAGRIKLFTHDCTIESKPYLESGVISATICQDPYHQGYLPVKILFDYLLDKKLPESELIHTKTDIMIREIL